MSDKFSKEMRIANRLRSYLIENNYQIVQLVSPGGQCPLSVGYTHPNTLEKRTCFPDVICFSHEEILIGEMKPKFSLADKAKLLLIKNSKDGFLNIKSLLAKRIPNMKELPIKVILIHGEEGHGSDNLIEQIIVRSQGILRQ